MHCPRPSMANEPGKATLYFVRHADKKPGQFFNERMRHQDPPLSCYGRIQARQIGWIFRHEDIKAIYISEYIRTLQTARPLARRLKLPPIVDARLNEIDNGEVEGLTESEIQAKYAETWRAYQERNKDFRWPGGETGVEAQARIVSFLDEHGSEPGDKLIVSHEGIIKLLLCHLLKLPVYRRFEFRLGTIGWLETEWKEREQGWTVVRFGRGNGTEPAIWSRSDEPSKDDR